MIGGLKPATAASEARSERKSAWATPTAEAMAAGETGTRGHGRKEADHQRGEERSESSKTLAKAERSSAARGLRLEKCTR